MTKDEHIKQLEQEKCELLGIIQGKDKAIKELEERIEKMKCCMKCEHWYYYKSFCDKDNSYHSEGQSCEHFILRR